MPEQRRNEPLSKEKTKYLRQLGHALKPVVTVAGKGLSDTVLAELQRALEDHELVKVKLNVEDKAALTDQLCQAVEADLVQAIGHIILIHRPAQQVKPKLSALVNPR